MNQLLRTSEHMLLADVFEALWDRAGIRGTVAEIQPRVDGKHDVDAEVILVLDGQHHHYYAECKSVIDRKAQLDQIDVKLKKFGSPGMLVTEYISKELATHCRAIGVQFADTHGNAYLRALGLFVFMVGEKNDRRHPSLKAPKGLTNAASIRVVFALLSQPRLINATFKDIAKYSSVALGTAYNVLADLEQRGYLLVGAKDGRKLLEPSRLLEEWATNFPTTLRVKLNSRRFSCPDPYWWKKINIADFRAVWGGEVAAAKMFKYLNPATQTVYADAQNMHSTINAFMRNFQIRPDPEGSIEVIEKFWSSDIETEAGIAPSLLVYSDLLSLLDPRAKETANIIRENFIDHTLSPG